MIVLAATALIAGCSSEYWSCIAAARSVSGLSLALPVTVDSCTGLRSVATELIVRLDSAGLMTAISEAKQRHFLPVDSLAGIDRVNDNNFMTNDAIARRLKVQHGWYLSSLGVDPNGGYRLVVIDSVGKRVLIERSSM